MMKTREAKKTPTGKILILTVFILCMLFCSACSLRSIRIPAGTKVAENAFKGCPDVVIDREEP